MSNPFDNDSRWTYIGSRFDNPQWLIDEYRKMIRDHFGDEWADAMEAAIPPPYGTLGVDKDPSP